MHCFCWCSLILFSLRHQACCSLDLRYAAIWTHSIANTACHSPCFWKCSIIFDSPLLSCRAELKPAIEDCYDHFVKLDTLWWLLRPCSAKILLESFTCSFCSYWSRIKQLNQAVWNDRLTWPYFTKLSMLKYDVKVAVVIINFAHMSPAQTCRPF